MQQPIKFFQFTDEQLEYASKVYPKIQKNFPSIKFKRLASVLADHFAIPTVDRTTLRSAMHSYWKYGTKSSPHIPFRRGKQERQRGATAYLNPTNRNENPRTPPQRVYRSPVSSPQYVRRSPRFKSVSPPATPQRSSRFSRTSSSVQRSPRFNHTTVSPVQRSPRFKRIVVSPVRRSPRLARKRSHVDVTPTTAPHKRFRFVHTPRTPPRFYHSRFDTPSPVSYHRTSHSSGSPQLETSSSSESETESIDTDYDTDPSFYSPPLSPYKEFIWAPNTPHQTYVASTPSPVATTTTTTTTTSSLLDSPPSSQTTHVSETSSEGDQIRDQIVTTEKSKPKPNFDDMDDESYDSQFFDQFKGAPLTKFFAETWGINVQKSQQTQIPLANRPSIQEFRFNSAQVLAPSVAEFKERIEKHKNEKAEHDALKVQKLQEKALRQNLIVAVLDTRPSKRKNGTKEFLVQRITGEAIWETQSQACHYADDKRKVQVYLEDHLLDPVLNIIPQLPTLQPINNNNNN